MLDAALAGYLNQQPQDFTPEGKPIILIENLAVCQLISGNTLYNDFISRYKNLIVSIYWHFLHMMESATPVWHGQLCQTEVEKMNEYG